MPTIELCVDRADRLKQAQRNAENVSANGRESYYARNISEKLHDTLDKPEYQLGIANRIHNNLRGGERTNEVNVTGSSKHLKDLALKTGNTLS